MSSAPLTWWCDIDSETKISSKHWPGLFRLAGAAVLAVAFFLPVSSCSSSFTVNHEAEQVVGADAEPDVSYEAENRNRYPFRMLELDDPKSVLIVLAYFWPIVAVIYRKVSRHKTSGKFIALELILSLLTIYVVSTLAFLERLEIGAYFAFGGVALYLIAAAEIFTGKIKRWSR